MTAISLMEHVGMQINPFGSASQSDFEAKSQQITSSSPVDVKDISYTLEIAESLKDPGCGMDINRWLKLYPKLPALNPQKIHIVQQSIFKESYLNIDIYWRLISLVNNLVIKGYDAGYNDFIFTLGNNLSEYIPSEMGDMLRLEPLRYTVFGDSDTPKYLTNCIGLHRGNVFSRSSFNNCINSRITVYGDVGSAVGSFSQGCEFDFFGDVEGNALYRCADCTATFHSDMDHRVGEHSQNCTYRTISEERFPHIVSCAEKGKGNKVQLITPEGNLLKEVRL